MSQKGTGVGVGVGLGVGVDVGVGVSVGVGVNVDVGVGVDVGASVDVGVCVGVEVRVGVTVARAHPEMRAKASPRNRNFSGCTVKLNFVRLSQPGEPATQDLIVMGDDLLRA